jgi:predicted TIM-barrel enzyme
MSSNVTTPIMIGIDDAGNYKAVRVNSQDGGITDLNSTAIGGELLGQDIYKLANVVDAGSAATDPTKLAVDQYKSFGRVKSYAITNTPTAIYENVVLNAIADFIENYGSRYDDIIINVTQNNPVLNSNINIFITIIRYFS